MPDTKQYIWSQAHRIHRMTNTFTLGKVPVCVKQRSMSVNIQCLHLRLKTQNRRHVQRHLKGRRRIVLNSCTDPIGEQNDVRDLAAFVNLLCIFGIAGTVPMRYCVR